MFSALAMVLLLVAMSMIQEVRRQFHNIPALKNALEVMNQMRANLSDWSEDDKKSFDEQLIQPSTESVEISTQSAIKEMVALDSSQSTVAIGFGGGAPMLGGLLAGVIRRFFLPYFNPMQVWTMPRKW